MLDLFVRPIQAYVTLPLVKFLGKSVTPNQVSFGGFLVGLASAYALYLGNHSLGFGLWLVNRYIDMLDGAIARATNQQTDFGGYFDIVLDFIVYSALPLALVLHDPDITKLTWLSLMFSSFFVNCVSQFYLAGILEKRSAGAAAKKELTTLTMPPALVEGLETVVTFSLFILVPQYLVLLFQCFTAGVYFNVLQRLHYAYFNLC